MYLGPDAVNIGVVQEEKRLVRRCGRPHIAEDDAVDCNLLVLLAKRVQDMGVHTLSMGKTLEHLGHAEVVVEGINGVHDRRIVSSDLHITNDLVAVFILAHTSVELAAEAVRAVSGGVV